MQTFMKIGYDAKRIVRNGTGLGNYGRTLVNDIAQYDAQLDLRLYAPDKGRDELRDRLWRRTMYRSAILRSHSCPSIRHGGEPLGW